MKRIGLVGGLSPQSTVEYYLGLCRAYNEKFGAANFPPILINSLNLEEVSVYQNAGQWDKVAEIIARAIIELEAAGADFTAITANTPHNAFELIERKVYPTKVLSIMQATALHIKKSGLNKVALLGTKPTMEFGVFVGHYRCFGIEAVIPPEQADRDLIHKVIWNELVVGQLKTESKEAYLRIIAQLVEQAKIEGVILGCTEIGELIKAGDLNIPIFDTTQIHIQAILDYALQD